MNNRLNQLSYHGIDIGPGISGRRRSRLTLAVLHGRRESALCAWSEQVPDDPLSEDFSFGYFSAEITRRLHVCVDEGGFVCEHDDLAILSQLDEAFGDS